MNTKANKIAGWIVFAIALIVYYMSAERVGSLWDCGEFITGAYKLEVVHPPGAPLFILIGRMFTLPADWFASDPAMISFSVNLMSGVCAAFTAAFVAWTTGLFGRLALVGRDNDVDENQELALGGAGLVAGLATAFCSSIWFSAVEGEVYAMSTFFTGLVVWSSAKWYTLPDTPKTDRWLIFTVYAAGLSIGVHLLSLLAFPAIGMLYYFKKYEKPNFWGMVLAALAGVLFFAIVVQKMIVVGIPSLWSNFELFAVNTLGLPFQSGVFLLIAYLVALFIGLIGTLRGHSYAKYLVILGIAIPALYTLSDLADGGASVRLLGRLLLLVVAGVYTFLNTGKSKYLSSRAAELMVFGALMLVLGYSTVGVVVIRANANTPINMNTPSDPIRLIPYINREQYGERELLRGPWYGANPVSTETTPRYGQVGDKYEVVDYKVSYEWDDRDLGFLPRMQDSQASRVGIYTMWRGGDSNKPTFGDNVAFTLQYQIGWMYWRYFFWNFVGRQNADQGYYSWDVKDGNWMSGIAPLDEARLYNQSELPATIENDKARNFYYGLPFIFGLLGMFFHFKNRPNDALALLALFIITGIGIILYSNQPPNEPRERDYVLVGSFLTYCIWIGMGVLALFELLRNNLKSSGKVSAIAATAIVLIAPILMGTQNFDDHSRSDITASRDYAANFLNSVEEDQGSIIFTYGDNDTYPLWYAQETEEIRTDVRVANLSLIAVDWYIEQLRRKTNESPAVNFTVSSSSYRGNNRNTVPIVEQAQVKEMSLKQALEFINKDLPNADNDPRRPKAYLPTRRLFIPVDKQKVLASGTVAAKDADKIVDRIYINLPADKNYLVKDELAILDVIGSNLWDRPVYFAVTCRPEKMFGLQDYMQLEGLGLRIVPIKTEASPERRQYGQVYGAGRVATDKVFKHFTEDFAYGNFDKEDVFVDHSYGPSVQSHRVALLRTVRQMISENDTTRAVALTDKYFEAFPHMNFPYDYNTMYLLNAYMAAGAKDKAKPHLEIMANEAVDWLTFYESLSPELMDPENDFGFFDDYRLMVRTADDALRAIKEMDDQEFKDKYVNMLEPFLPKRENRQMLPGGN